MHRGVRGVVQPSLFNPDQKDSFRVGWANLNSRITPTTTIAIAIATQPKQASHD